MFGIAVESWKTLSAKAILRDPHRFKSIQGNGSRCYRRLPLHP
jgi:hypothetical protein